MEAIKVQRADWQNLGGAFALCVCGAAIVGVWRSLEPLFVVWNQAEYSHAWFILPLSVLIFLQRLRTSKFGGNRSIGACCAILSVAIMLFGWATGGYTITIYAALLGLVGFVWSSLGLNAMKTLAAPLLYLFFMVPLPIALYLSASAEMQLLASKLGLFMMSLLHVTASLDGNIITLRSTKLEVAEACNGLRYLFPLISFAFLISMLVEDRLWKKAFILASSIPIAVLLNAGRIAVIAVLIDRFDIDTSSGPTHALEGFAVFMLCILLLFIEVWCLLRIGRSRGRFVVSDMLMPDRDSFRRLKSWPTSRTSMLTGAVLLVAAGLFASLPARSEIVPPRQTLALFPMDLGDWRGTPQVLDDASLGALGLTDYVLADYLSKATDGQPINFYVAYYASQRAGVHAHSPQLCIPGGGWNILRQSIIDMPLAGGGSIPANRVVIEKQGTRRVVYYWFEERGRHIAKEADLKYYGLRDALVDSRSDGALVRVVSPIFGQDEAATDKIVAQFVGEAYLSLRTYVPG